jgi:hypothetical protein
MEFPIKYSDRRSSYNLTNKLKKHNHIKKYVSKLLKLNVMLNQFVNLLKKILHNQAGRKNL